MSLQPLTKVGDFSFSVRRSARRRTISIEVRDAEVVVRSPLGVSDQVLHQFVCKKRSWVLRKLAAQRTQLARVPEYNYQSGSLMPWLGRSLQLSIQSGTAGSVMSHGDLLCVTLSSRSRLSTTEQTRALVSRWYREQALSVLSAKSHALANRLGLQFREVKVRVTRSKWGHCTSAGILQYNWHIVLAPEPVVDYLVAHEVCHLRHMNHSADFWALVASVCPEYRTHRTWLKANGRSLVL
ncbi:M48 family metallopeptidase [Marinimicrobium sp. ABcell2]|uniref:M48 family metallopeptidase n=1 Tax=Marinimicrobium sp. ABcell2 TaxID=3069751 RepID=UPI0027B085B7|nr:SprT family zinc-dependent metalloprotease [Marinimicrobium sp. ABcell2]MDQ2076501.1 SprT family zinc-dependent metalloprotease [Marinimicrobium sp. ABcell2]